MKDFVFFCIIYSTETELRGKSSEKKGRKTMGLKMKSMIARLHIRVTWHFLL